MRTKSKIIVLLSFAVQFSGLTSCASEKQPMLDDLQLKAPVIRWDENLSLRFDEASKTSVPLYAEVHFDPAQTKLEGLYLNVTSHCMIDQVKSSKLYKQTNLSAIRIISLLPLNFFEPDYVISKKQMRCRFDFVATNQVGSTHSFSMGPVRFAAENINHNLQLHRIGEFAKSNTPDHLNIKDIKDYHLQTIDHTAIDRIHLLCRSFRLEQHLDSPSYSTYLEAKLSEMKSNHPFQEATDLPLQKCRILTVGGGKLIGATALFNLKIAAPKVDVSTTHLDKAEALTYWTLLNNNPYSVFIYINTGDGVAVTLRGKSSGFKFKTTAKLGVKINDHGGVNFEGNGLVRLKPGAHLTLRGHLKTEFNTSDMRFSTPEKVKTNLVKITDSEGRQLSSLPLKWRSHYHLSR